MPWIFCRLSAMEGDSIEKSMGVVCGRATVGSVSAVASYVLNMRPRFWTPVMYTCAMASSMYGVK